MEFHMTDTWDETFPHMDFTLDLSLLNFEHAEQYKAA